MEDNRLVFKQTKAQITQRLVSKAHPLQKRLGKAGWAKQRCASVEQRPRAQPSMQFMEKVVQLLCLAQKLMIFEILKSAGKM